MNARVIPPNALPLFQYMYVASVTQYVALYQNVALMATSTIIPGILADAAGTSRNNRHSNNRAGIQNRSKQADLAT